MKRTIFLIFVLSALSLGQKNKLKYHNYYSGTNNPSYAVDLNGTDENMTLSGISIGTNFSVLFWGKPTDAASTYCAVAGNTTGDSYPLLLEVDSPTIFSHDGTSNVNVVPLAFVNEWHLYAVVRNGTNVKFYIDGVQVGTDKTLATNNSLTITQIGTRKSQFWFKGLYGEVQILTGSLDPAETGSIKSNYASATIQMWYKWEGATDAEMLNDHSANNRDLTGNNVTISDQVKLSNGYK